MEAWRINGCLYVSAYLFCGGWIGFGFMICMEYGGGWVMDGGCRYIDGVMDGFIWIPMFT